MKIRSVIIRFADEILNAAETAVSRGFNAIEIQCSKKDHCRVNRAIAAAAAARPDLLDDDSVSEHWEPNYIDGELIPTWYVPIRPADFENPSNLGEHNSEFGESLYLC